MVPQLDLLKQKSLNFSAGSGLVLWQDQLWAVTDNEDALYHSALNVAETDLRSLDFVRESMGPESGLLAKKIKSDWESLGVFDEQLILFPSFSTSTRNRGTYYSNSGYQTVIFENLRASLWKQFKAPNIEGFANRQNYVYLLQRGNSEWKENGLIKISATNFPNKIEDILFQTWDLGQDQGFPWTWTDLSFINDDQFLFSASLELSQSTYADGEIYGSKIGLAYLQTKKIEWLFEIRAQKIEGICFDQKSGLVYSITDPDDTNLKSQLIVFQLTQ